MKPLETVFTKQYVISGMLSQGLSTGSVNR
jgi:hypothetical protein